MALVVEPPLPTFRQLVRGVRRDALPARSAPHALRSPPMSLMSDRWITRMAAEQRMIEPFEHSQIRAGVISYGVSSYGYDMRVAREFRIFTNVLNSIVDPKAFDPKSFVEFEGDVCIVPPNSFALARSVEYFRIPRNVLTVTVGKSTYARCGRSRSRTPRPCRRRSTRMKASRRCYSSVVMRSPPSRTRTRRGNTRVSRA
jgi:hypothetical protein